MFAVLLTAKAGSGKDTLASIFQRRNDALNLKIARPLKAVCSDVLERVFGLPRDRASYLVEEDKNQPILFEDVKLSSSLSPMNLTLYSIFQSRFRNVEDPLLMAVAEDLAFQFSTPSKAETAASPFADPKICGRELTGRRLAQNLGTIFKDRCGDDFWTQRACDEIINVAAGCGDPRLCRPIVVTDLRFPSEAEALGRTLDFLCIPKVIVRIRRETPTGDKNACPADSDVSAHPSELAMESIDVDAEIRNDARTPETFQEAAYDNILKLISAKQEGQEIN